MAIDGTDQLKIWNDALLLAGERRLSSLTENREPVRLLTVAWQTAVDYCLEEGEWAFAVRTVKLDYDPGYEPDFGYKRLYTKPDDWIRTVNLCSDEYFQSPILEYRDEAGFWITDWDNIFVRYISNDDSYGLNSSLWPQSYRKFIAAYLAMQIAPILKNGSDMQMIAAEYQSRRNIAMNRDALRNPTKIVPPGNFVLSRWGANYYRR